MKKISIDSPISIKIDSNTISIDSPIKISIPSDTPSYDAVIKKLQTDLQFMQKTLSSMSQRTVTYSGGGGEVRILNMDDVAYSQPINNDTLIWDSSMQKFILQQLPISLQLNTILSPLTIPINTTYAVSSYFHAKSDVRINGILHIH